MVIYNLKLALRSIRKNKVFSLINISGLAVSMACLLVICFFILNELNHDKFHSKIDRIFRVTEKQDQAGQIYNVAVTPYPLADVLKQEFPGLENSTRMGYWSGVLQNAEQSIEIKKMLYTENSLFSVFDFKVVKGNPGELLNSQDGLVITEKIARQFFGKDWRTLPDLIGQEFKLNNQAVFKLAGIVENVPENSSIEFDVLLPLSQLVATDPWSNKWNSNNFHTYILLKNAASAASIERKISGILKKFNKGTKDVLELQPFSEQFLYSKFDFNTDWGKRSDVKYIRIFLAIGFLLLLIACINFVNLSTARSIKRAMEVGVRKLNGASRNQLIRQFLLESIIITGISGVLALVAVELSQPVILELTGYDIRIPGSLFLFGSLYTA
jgi:ABC-type antimicrobial peptide transport system permease subunit